MKITNFANLPQPIVDAISKDTYSKRGKYSATGLIKPVQVSKLSERYDEDISVDAIDRFWATYGKLTHKILEEYDGNGLSEVAMMMDFPTVSGHAVSVSGTIDRVNYFKDPNSVGIQDYKVTSAWSLVYDPKGKDEWVKQLNIYAELARYHYQLPVTKLEIVAILRDWSRSEARRNGEYPQGPVQTIEIELWPDQKVFDYISERVELYEKFDWLGWDDADLPKCSEEEQWAQPTKFAIKKEGRKTALRVFDSLPELEVYAYKKGLMLSSGSYVKGHSMEIRPGVKNRCAAYCDAAEFCTQKKDEEL